MINHVITGMAGFVLDTIGIHTPCMNCMIAMCMHAWSGLEQNHCCICYCCMHGTSLMLFISIDMHIISLIRISNVCIMDIQ